MPRQFRTIEFRHNYHPDGGVTSELVGGWPEFCLVTKPMMQEMLSGTIPFVRVQAGTILFELPNASAGYVVCGMRDDLYEIRRVRSTGGTP